MSYPDKDYERDLQHEVDALRAELEQTKTTLGHVNDSLNKAREREAALRAELDKPHEAAECIAELEAEVMAESERANENARTIHALRAEVEQLMQLLSEVIAEG